MREICKFPELFRLPGGFPSSGCSRGSKSRLLRKVSEGFPMSLKKIAIVYNPKGGSASIRKIELLAGYFTARGIQVYFRPTTPEPGSAKNLTTEAVELGVDLVIAFGGDGTAEQVGERARATTT